MKAKHFLYIGAGIALYIYLAGKALKDGNSITPTNPINDD